MKKLFLLLVTMAGALAIMPAAKADSFDYTLALASGTPVTAHLDFTKGPANHSGNGSITSGTLVVYANSNSEFPAGTYTLQSGTYSHTGSLSLTFVDGNLDTIVITQTAGGVWRIVDIDSDPAELINVAHAPEPSSLLLLGSGLLILAFGLYFKSSGAKMRLAQPGLIPAS